MPIKLQTTAPAQWEATDDAGILLGRFPTKAKAIEFMASLAPIEQIVPKSKK